MPQGRAGPGTQELISGEPTYPPLNDSGATRLSELGFGKRDGVHAEATCWPVRVSEARVYVVASFLDGAFE